MRRIWFLAIFALMYPTDAFPQTTPKESLLVLSKHEHTLAVVDPAALKGVARVTVGGDPREGIADADGKNAHGSDYGGGGDGGPRMRVLSGLAHPPVRI